MTDNRMWQDASVEERQAVVDMYNKHYDNVNEPITMQEANWAWTDRRWDTIYYTFGVEPIN